MGQGPGTDLVISHGTHDDGAHHAGQRAHAVGDAHEDAGIARGDVQMVHVEPFASPGQPHPPCPSTDTARILHFKLRSMILRSFLRNV